MSIKNLLRKADYFGTPITFNINKSNNFTTAFGGLITILSFFILALLIYGFGQDFLQRLNPKYMMQTLYPEQCDNHTLTNKNFTFAFRVEDYDGNIFDQPELIYLTAFFRYEVIEGGEWVTKEAYNFNVSRCVKTDFGLEDQFDRLNLKDWFCPRFPENFKMGGYWDGTYVRTFTVRGYMCKDGNAGPGGLTCKGQEALKNIITKKIYFSTFYQRYSVDPGNYLNPFRIYYTTTYNLIDLSIMKRVFYHFKKGTIRTDFGWLFESIKEESGVSLSYTDFDFVSKDILPDSEKSTLFESVVYFTRESELFTRAFTKIQELAATVGGIIKLFIILCEFLLSFYSKSLLFYDILSKDYDFHSTKLENEYKFGFVPNNNSQVDRYTFYNNSTNQFKNNRSEFIHSNLKRSNEIIPSASYTSRLQMMNFNTIQYRFKFTFWKMLYNLCPFTRKQKEYNLLINKVYSNLDIHEYFKFRSDFRNLRLLALEPFYSSCLSFFEKEKYDFNANEKLESEEKLIIDFYKSKISQGSLGEKDKIVLNKLNDRLKAKIVL
jgi:hypothetical protein